VKGGIKMKLGLITILLITIFISIGCRKEVVSLNPYEQSILESAVFTDISRLQSGKEKEILSKNKIKNMSFINEYTNSDKLDSLGFLELDQKGKIIRRTYYDECLEKMIRQAFSYNDETLLRADHYTYRYKTNSALERWMEKDTSHLIKFEWEDYTYNGDTITVESGATIWKYIMDENGNIKKSQTIAKTNSHKIEDIYITTPQGIQLEIIQEFNGSPIKDHKQYIVSINKVIELSSLSSMHSRKENIYDERGLLVAMNYYREDKLYSTTRVKYSYY
jgi:hypothetical protein